MLLPAIHSHCFRNVFSPGAVKKVRPVFSITWNEFNFANSSHSLKAGSWGQSLSALRASTRLSGAKDFRWPLVGTPRR